VQAGLAGRVVPRARDIRRAGSAALDLCSLACGRLDGFYEAPMEPWDKAAGLLIATEAGAIFSELPPPRPGLSPGLIGANWTLHDALRELLIA
jgi:myo-inositol-1(or 4)-monophosphatase